MGCCWSDKKDSKHSKSSNQQKNAEGTPLLAAAFARPHWEADENAVACYSCSKAFDMIQRRHHCRRCRNVFCGECSDYKRELLMYNIQSEVRVCRICNAEAPKENEFVARHLPLLKRGSAMSQHVLMGRRAVYLSLSDDMCRLEYREHGKRGAPPSIAFKDIESVYELPNVSMACWEIRGGQGTVRFDAGMPAEARDWTAAITEAARRSKAPALKDRVEQERQARRKQEQLKRTLMQRQEETQQKKMQRQQNRDRLRQKYGLNGRSHQ